MAKFWLHVIGALWGVGLVGMLAATGYGRALPHGDQLLYTVWHSSPDGSPYEMHLLDVDQGLDAVLMNNLVDPFPAWSPDGQRIVFSKLVQEQSQLFIMDVGSQSAAPYTELVPVLGSAAWSSDGTRIAFSREYPTIAIGILDVAKRSITMLDVDPTAPGGFTWSPDGRWLTYIDRQLGGRSHLFGVACNANGCESKPQAILPDFEAASPLQWSQDGQYATLGRSIGNSYQLHQFNFVCADLANVDCIQDAAPPFKTDYAGYFIMAAAWSPNAQQLGIVLGDYSIGVQQIEWVDLADPEQRHVIEASSISYTLAWSADNDKIAFPILTADKYYAIEIVNVRTNETTVLKNDFALISLSWRP